MECRNAIRRTAALGFALLISATGFAQYAACHFVGRVVDPAGRYIPGVILIIISTSGERLTSASGKDGSFAIDVPAWGAYTVKVEAAGFAPLVSKLNLTAGSAEVTLRLDKISSAKEEVIVNADVSKIDIASPDPSQKVLVREELLDANPGRPGAPISIPGLPIETASGGIKAPQYFAPGVAGDHGEPIAQYIEVGGFLVPNNLSANAHGNGYADPNIFVSAGLGSVQTDGGAYNVLEGNHSLNLAATYGLRPRLARFVTLTGDYRDIDLAGSLAAADPAKREWLTLEANYGNGLLKRLEHRQQFKLNGLRVIDAGHHEVSVFGAAYYGNSHEGNLVPVGNGLEVGDTVDPRQQDQTHTGLFAANDQWTVNKTDVVSASGFFRTYNLALFSDFGEGLIRQSEFRTVEGADLRETHTFKPWMETMAGVLYNEDDIRNDNLDHYLSDVPQSSGTFVKVLGNNVTVREFAPYVAMRGELGQHFRFYGGLRNEQILLINRDKLRPQYSFDLWDRFENPKATIAWAPGTGPARWLPTASFSLGQAFFTQDPRINVAPSATLTGVRALANPLERSHALQVVLEKEILGNDLRVTAGRTTMTATSGKIDPDDGTAFDLGPSTLEFLTLSARHQFFFGSLQGIFSKADARLKSFNGVQGTVTPEAPRTIFDALATLDRLPFDLHVRAEYEFVGHKFLDVGNAGHPDQYEAIPVGETRFAIVRSFLDEHLELALNTLVARGYTGQTTETFDPNWTLAAHTTNLPYCAPGSGPSGMPNDFDCGTVERSVGIRTASYLGGSVSWRFNSLR